MQDIIRGALVAGLVGSAALGLAGGAAAATTGSHPPSAPAAADS